MEIAVFNLGLVMEIVVIKMILPHVGTLMEMIVVQKRTQWEMKVVILTIVNNARCHYDKGDCCDDSMIGNGKCDATNKVTQFQFDGGDCCSNKY